MEKEIGCLSHMQLCSDSYYFRAFYSGSHTAELSPEVKGACAACAYSEDLGGLPADPSGADAPGPGLGPGPAPDRDA